VEYSFSYWTSLHQEKIAIPTNKTIVQVWQMLTPCIYKIKNEDKSCQSWDERWRHKSTQKYILFWIDDAVSIPYSPKMHCWSLYVCHLSQSSKMLVSTGFLCQYGVKNHWPMASVQTPSQHGLKIQTSSSPSPYTRTIFLIQQTWVMIRLCCYLLCAHAYNN